MTRQTIALLLLCLAACAPAAGPGDSPGVITPLTLEPPPIYALLGYRNELSLESAQVSALDSIARSVREADSPLIDSLRVVGRSRGGRYSGMMVLDEQTAPILERIRENHRAAVEGVREVLTDAQEATTCRLFDQARDRRREQMRRARVAETDSTAASLGGRVWSWCGAPAGAGGTG